MLFGLSVLTANSGTQFGHESHLVGAFIRVSVSIASVSVDYSDLLSSI
jgi:hypothetical protein